MDGLPQPKEEDVKSPQQPINDSSSSKRRKVMQKSVVTVKIEANVGGHKGEGPPSDFWSWRKYGQKPIKGSPHPRGYYKCSTSKGCSAKKQVDRCNVDGSIIIITYTSDHNHPPPDPLSLTSTSQPSQEPSPTPSSTEQPNATCEPDSIADVMAPPNCSQDSNQQNPEAAVRQVKAKSSNDSINMVSSPTIVKSEERENENEDDFFDELEDLNISSSLTSLWRNSSVFDERIILLP